MAGLLAAEVATYVSQSVIQVALPGFAEGNPPHFDCGSDLCPASCQEEEDGDCDEASDVLISRGPSTMPMSSRLPVPEEKRPDIAEALQKAAMTPRCVFRVTTITRTCTGV
jgi:hypothetical protein